MVTAQLTACLEALQAARTFARDVRGTSACLELRPGALEAAAALVIRVLTTLTTSGRGGTLQRFKYTWGYYGALERALTVNFPAAMRRLQRQA